MKQEFYPTDMKGHVRTDKYLAKTRPDLDRFYIQKLLRSGWVLVNGQGVKVDYIVVEEDRAELEAPEAMELEIDAEPTDLGILYENQDVILTNKPKGMAVHPTAGHYSHTLANSLMYHCRDQLPGTSGVIRPGIVYRIDMDTTGVITTCKNDMVHGSIAAQFKEHSIIRRYQAIVHGAIMEDEGTVDAPIGRHPVRRKKININYQNGKDAATHCRILNRFRQYTHVECRLGAGRTHQICAHMASIRHPLLGDAVRGPARCPIGGLYDQTLRVGVLGFVHPGTEEYMESATPLPKYLDKLLRTLDWTRTQKCGRNIL